MAYLEKLLCPNSEAHKRWSKENSRYEPYNKILMIYRPGRSWAKAKFWLHCGGKSCNKWWQVTFSSGGIPRIEEMPEDVIFDTKPMPAVVMKNARTNKSTG